MPTPAFINIEGTDRSGKTTLATRLAADLTSEGVPVVVLHDPGGTPLGLTMRELIKSSKSLQPMTELFVFCAARHEMVETRIKPALDSGHTVITARFTPSTLAYQGRGRELPMETVKSISASAAAGLQPDLTVILDIDEATARARGKDTSDRFERERAAFYRRVRLGYLEYARENPDECEVIDASASETEVWLQLKKMVEHTLNR